jgi:large subunit ribosomal protein L10
MPKTRAQKVQIVDELAEKLSRTKSVVFTSVAGYTMEDADKLRAKGRDLGVEISMTKKNLLRLALKKAGFAANEDQLSGSLLTALGLTDEVAPAKLMAGLAKDRDAIKIMGGFLGAAAMDRTQVLALSALPSKEELLAKLVGSLNAPRSGFVQVLAGNLRGLVTALKAIGEKASS